MLRLYVTLVFFFRFVFDRRADCFLGGLGTFEASNMEAKEDFI